MSLGHICNGEKFQVMFHKEESREASVYKQTTDTAMEGEEKCSILIGNSTKNIVSCTARTQMKMTSMQLHLQI